MKKQKLSVRAKRTLSITVLMAICVGTATLAVVHNHLGSQAQAEQVSSAVTFTSAPVSIPEIVVVSQTSSTSSAFVPSSGASGVSSLTEISKPSSIPPKPVVSGSPKAINSALTNKSSQPSYSRKAATSSKKSDPQKNSGTKPSGGQPGQVYVPGFGWQYPEGKNDVTVVGGNWGEGSEVGIMD